VEKTPQYLLIGKILKPSGLKGEIKVYPYTDHITRFKNLSFVFLKNGESYKKIDVEYARIMKEHVVLKLKGYDTNELAERLRGSLLFIDRENAVPLNKGSFYYYDLNGCVVKTEQGEVLGTLYNIYKAESCDVYIVSDRKNKENDIYIPAISDIIKKIDIKNKEIVIEPVEGLL